MSNLDLVARLFLQLATILLVCQLIAYLGMRFLGQTRVVCEMIAGILLGPSFFGLIAPHLQTFLFPNQPIFLQNGQSITHPSMLMIYGLSQIGLVFYLFLIGLEFNVGIFKHQIQKVSLISLTGMLTPFVLGVCITPLIINTPNLIDATSSVTILCLFLGISMSVTAFPMLARIIYEHNLTNTRVGTLALAAGALDDVMVWIALAGIISLFKHNGLIFVTTLVGGGVYVMGLALLRKTKALSLSKNESQYEFTYLLIILLFCAWFSDTIGIYAIFGAFMAGLSAPKDSAFVERTKNKLEAVAVTFLLPIFFVYSGLNTHLTQLNSSALIGTTLLVTVVAFLGKGAACTLISRYLGESWRNAGIIGILMNSRGLMELIVLNIGLENHLITPTFFSMMVVMAMITTFVTSPLFNYFYRGKHQ